MIERSPERSSDAKSQPAAGVPAEDAADYLSEITRELSDMARTAGLTNAAFALEQARAFVAESLIERDRAHQPDAENAESGDAA